MLAELAAAEIAKIAFEAVIGKLTEGAMDKGVELCRSGFSGSKTNQIRGDD